MKVRALLLSITPVFSSLLVILGAFGVGAVFLAAGGKDPVKAYGILLGVLWSRPGVIETLIKMAPVLLVSAGLLITLKAGVWNIGIDGQFLFGACVAGVVAPKLAGVVPLPVVLFVTLVIGFAGGTLWAVLPAILKVRYGLNEIITTIMTNYLAIYLTSWLVKGPFKDPKSVPPQTPVIPLDSRLPAIPLTDGQVHIGLLVGLAAILMVAVLFRNTTLGFKLRVHGINPRTAIHAGMPVGLLTVLALLLSGGFAGIAGANDVLGVKGLFQGEWNPGYGLMGFSLVFLARLKPMWVLPFAYFFSFLLYGGEIMSRKADIPVYFVQMLEGLMLVFFAGGVYLERVYLERGRRSLQVAGEGA